MYHQNYNPIKHMGEKKLKLNNVPHKPGKYIFTVSPNLPTDAQLRQFQYDLNKSNRTPILAYSVRRLNNTEVEVVAST